MKLINLTEEQNEQLKKMHMDAMNDCDRFSLIASELGDDEYKRLGLIAYTIARFCFNLGDFEKHPNFPEF